MVIFVISREDWGVMRMSKHNYALSLAELGYLVYFINCPDRKRSLRRGQVIIENTEIGNLKIVRHRTIFPTILKGVSFFIYRILISLHIKNILRVIGCSPNVVWSFDAGAELPIKFFGKKNKKIYMPVDGPFGDFFELYNAYNTDIIVSVSDKILERYQNFSCAKYLVNHGVHNEFLKFHFTNLPQMVVKKIGYSGSLLRNDLKHELILDIIKSHENLLFEFWGEFEIEESTIHESVNIDKTTIEFLNILKAAPNVLLHGPVSQKDLALGLNKMDILFLAYQNRDIQNSHKVNEYLSTGKVIVSTYMSAFSNSDLICMLNYNSSDADFKNLFNYAVFNYKKLMHNHLVNRRISHAHSFSYDSLTVKIMEAIS